MPSKPLFAGAVAVSTLCVATGAHALQAVGVVPEPSANSAEQEPIELNDIDWTPIEDITYVSGEVPTGSAGGPSSNAAPVPEPTSLMLLGLGGLALLSRRRRD